MKKNKKKRISVKIIFLLLPVILLCVLFLSWYLRTSYYHSDQTRRNDIAALTSRKYNCLLLSMCPTESLSEEAFSYFRGLAPLKADHRFETLSDIGSYLRTALNSGQEITHIYMVLDTAAISAQYGFHASFYQKEYDKQLLELVASNPQVQFEILLPYYSLEYWSSLSVKKQTGFFKSYEDFVNMFSGQPNMIIYFPGYEEWLIGNPGNYNTFDSCNPSVTSNLLALTFRDDHYMLTPDNMEIRLEILNNLIQNRNQETSTANSPDGGTSSPAPDLSQYHIIFFGDSVIGNFTDSLSVPGVVQGLSNAKAFNLAQGGTCASMGYESTEPSLNTIVDAFLADDPNALEPDSQPSRGLHTYLESISAGTSVKTCFIISYGLNDYFEGRPLESEDPFDMYTYKGSLRRAVSRLHEAYPDSVILLATPNFCTYHENGTLPQSSEGGALTDYVNAVLELSEELDVYSVDNYTGLGINASNQAQYLSDGCHPNEAGRYLMGRHILHALADHI